MNGKGSVDAETSNGCVFDDADEGGVSKVLVGLVDGFEFSQYSKQGVGGSDCGRGGFVVEGFVSCLLMSFLFDTIGRVCRLFLFRSCLGLPT
jgi:hypothetical protein